jgi:Cu2+-containing amine oxidase
MPVYNESNIKDHPVDSLKELKASVDVLRQQVEQLENHDHAVDIPDPLKHKYISFAKSAIRIGAGGCLIQGNLFFAGFLLIFAEILGVAEEMV